MAGPSATLRRGALVGERRFTVMTAIAENAAMDALRSAANELDKYLYMRNMHHENPNLYYKLLINNAQELLPVVYAPTVGQVYHDYSKLPIHIYGLVIRPEHRGRIYKRLKEWSGHHRVRVVVVTDGERVLGLGDLGFNGMAVAEAKILLYTVMAGVNPAVCMPCCLDVGTNNETLLADPTYKGLRQKRLRGQEYDDLVDEFMNAVNALHDHTLLQFEDFGNQNAFRLLDKYAPLQCSFNDDIQGTACITLAGVFSALRITGKAIEDQRIVVLGAGEAGTGVGQLICRAIRAETKLTVEESLQRCFYLDSKGLICKSRDDLQHHKLPFAHDVPFTSSLLDAVKKLKPTILVGASTQGGAFTQEIVELMAANNERPIIFPLSNPTTKSECAFEDAYKWTNGKVIFAAGSPYAPLEDEEGRMHYPSQSNNAYISFIKAFSKSGRVKNKDITEDVFLQAAKILAGMTPEELLETGQLFPSIGDMKRLVVTLIAGLAEFMVTSGLGRKPAAVTNWPDYIKSQMYQPGVTPALVVEKHLVVTRELYILRQTYTSLQRYLFLRHLQDTQTDIFWNLMINNAQELLPDIYTPTVGDACRSYCNLPIKTRGLYIREEDSGKILEKLQAWRHQDIRIVVVTDGERILGLGVRGLVEILQHALYFKRVFLLCSCSHKIFTGIQVLMKPLGADQLGWVNVCLQSLMSKLAGGEACCPRAIAVYGRISTICLSLSNLFRVVGTLNLDLGAGGMGISEGKIILYTVFSGVDPNRGLPVCIDVGTNRDSLLQDPQYYGVRRKRLRGEKYDALIDEFVHALKKWRPHVLLQFEDFGNTNAFRLLEKYRNVVCCFNDDIQATACITLTGILTSLRITGKKLEDQRILILGAGEAGTGIGHIVALALVQQCDLTKEEALKFCYMVDKGGLVCQSRPNLPHHKLPFAHDIAHQPDLLSSVRAVRPTVLIGASAVTGAFNKEVLEAMRECNERPVVFPLSNPTSRSECTFEEAYKYTEGSVVFASGSPFPNYVTKEGKTLYPAQANNSYVFGPVGMAAVLTKCTTITDDLFLVTAELLAGAVPEARLESGMLFPAFSDMKEVAPHLIAGICEFMVKYGHGTRPEDALDWLDYVKARMYIPPDNEVPAFPSSS